MMNLGSEIENTVTSGYFVFHTTSTTKLNFLKSYVFIFFVESKNEDHCVVR